MSSEEIYDALGCAEKLINSHIQTREYAIHGAYPSVDTSRLKAEVVSLRKHVGWIRRLQSRYVSVAPLETQPLPAPPAADEVTP